MPSLPRPTLTALLSLAAAAVTLSLSTGAFAADTCKSDADCGAGFFCEISSAPVVGCASKGGEPTDCPQPAPEPNPTGYCHEKPITCTTDADCPTYLVCASAAYSDTTCSAPACDGDNCPNPTCDPPKTDPNTPKICVPKEISCTSDAACPDSFACNIKVSDACAMPAGGPDSPQEGVPDCTPKTENFCGPKEMECKVDADCPSDWSCFSFEEESCSGGGSEPIPEDVPPPVETPSSPGSKAQHDSNCTTTTRALCVPKGYLAGIERGGGFLGASDSSTTSSSLPGSSENKESGAHAPSTPSDGSGKSEATNAASSDDNGCSTSPHGRKGAGMMGLLLVGLAAHLARRRSR